LFNSHIGPHPSKLRMCWLGPYRITTAHIIGTFPLSTLDGVMIPWVVISFHLKPYFVEVKAFLPSATNVENA